MARKSKNLIDLVGSTPLQIDVAEEHEVQNKIRKLLFPNKMIGLA